MNLEASSANVPASPDESAAAHHAPPALPVSPYRTFAMTRAQRRPLPLLLGLCGPSGAGKTYSALRLATGLARRSSGGIVMIDTENGRSRHYADTFAFEHIDMTPPFGSLDYQAALTQASAAKPAVIILDTLSHEHDGEGGMLEFCAAELDRLAGDNPNLQHRLQKAAWRRPRAARRALLGALTRLDAHCIVCFRASERTRQPREGLPETQDMGFTPIGGAEFLYDLTCSTLLRPGAQGVPSWASSLPGEHAAIKLPGQFAHLFAEGEPLSEAHGEAMAQWAAGPSRSTRRARPPGPAAPSKRTSTRSRTRRDGKVAAIAEAAR